MDGDSLLGGETVVPEGEQTATVTDENVVGTETNDNPSIYGELEVKWPEGLDDGLKNEHSIKPFVDKEGNVNYSNLMKSYVMTKKKVGSDRVAVPNEHSTEQEVNEFYEKLGYKSNLEEYEIGKEENDVLGEEFLNEFKEFAHKSKMPLKQANQMAAFLREKGKAGMEQEAKLTQQKINEGVEGLKQEWSNAFDFRIGLAQRVLKDVVADESILEALQDPTIGSNPVVIKALAKIGEKLFKEDSFSGQSNSNYRQTPDEAMEEINRIKGDMSGPYWDKSHPGHADAVKKMNKLFDIKNGL